MTNRTCNQVVTKFLMAVGIACGVSHQLPAQTELGKPTAFDAGSGDQFGNAVDIDNNVAIVGAWHESPPSTGGAAYVFRFNGTSWVSESKFEAFPADAFSGDEFGISVGISGDYAVVGVWQDDDGAGGSGSAYVFHYNTMTSTWAFDVELHAPTLAATDRFGLGVAIDGDVIAVGADRRDSAGLDAGSVSVFRRIASAWTFEQELVASDPQSLVSFAEDLAVDGDLVVAGARLTDDVALNAGSAYVFRYDAGASSWSQDAKLTAFDAGANDQFGSSVAVHGDVIAIGAPLDDVAALNDNRGSVYIYRYNGSSWSIDDKQTATDAVNGDNYGNSVAVNGDTLVVGAFLVGGQTGAAYLVNYNGAAWSETSKFFASDGAALDQFGVSAAVNDNLIALVGSWGDDDFGASSGSAYLFDVGVVTDADGDGLSDVDEVAWGTGANDADSDDDGLGDGLEVETAMLNGCAGPPGAGCCPHPLNADTDNDGLSDGQENNFGPNPCNPDVDSDGLLDGQEFSAGCPSQTDPDSDDDGLTDGAEANAGPATDPCDTDTDDDGLSDSLEIAFGTDGTDSDSDNDGLSDGTEVTMANGTGCPNPLVADSDGDSLSDGVESSASIDPCDADSDNDGLADGTEDDFGTSPTDSDSDNDGIPDGSEVSLAAGSGCPSPTNPDSDADGVDDGNELTAGLGPCDADFDNDGLSDGNEGAFNTDPANADTDGDGLLDGAEVDTAMGTGCPNPLVADSDSDTLPDGSETDDGTSPCNADTDGDGMTDNEDPSPTVPGVSQQVLAMMTLAVAGEIQDCDLSVFLGPNNNTRRARRTTLAASVAAAAILIHHGHYNAAHALLTIVENRIDGQSPPPDWMVSSSQKSTVHADVEMMIILLDFLD